MRHLLKYIQSNKPGLNNIQILQTEKILGASFPQQYKELLKLTNGPEISNWIFYPIKDPNNIKKTFDDVVRANVNEQHEEYDWIFIAEDGTGNQLCFKIENFSMLESIFLWDHETGTTRLIAKDISEFIVKESV